MLGYLKKPKETKNFFDKDGFAHTGDLVFYDENGDIYYVDRMKELIKYVNIHLYNMRHYVNERQAQRFESSVQIAQIVDVNFQQSVHDWLNE